jgi:hypothetical protein
MIYSRSLRSVGAAAVASLIAVLLVLHLRPADAQSSTPTKTPTPAPTAAAAPFEPLTQADLNVLTGNVQRPNGIGYFNDTLYTACTGDGTIYEIDARTGTTAAYIWGVTNAHSLYVEESDRALHMWIPDYAENTLKHVTRAGVERVVSGLQGPWGIAYLDDEQFLITNLMGGSMSRVTRDGDNTVVLEGLSSPTGIAHDGETVYVANNGSARRAIEWYSLDPLTRDDSSVTMPADHVLVSGLQNTTGLQLADDGNLYFAYSLANRGVVGRVDPQMCMENGGCTNADVEIVLYTDLDAPLAGLSISPDMRLFVHTMFAPELYWAQLNG